MDYFFLNNKNKSNIYNVIKKILISIKSLHNMNIPHQNLNLNSIIIYNKNNKNNFYIKFTDFLLDKYKIKSLTKKKNKSKFKIKYNEHEIETLKKKDLKKLIYIFLKLLNSTNNSFSFYNLFKNDKKTIEYKNIINNKLLCNLNDVENSNNILKELIFFEKYGED